jgi:hypothetical protein
MHYGAAAMTSADVSEQVAAAGDGPSELDALNEFSEKLNAFKTFRSNDDDAADRLIESVGGRGKVEEDRRALLKLGAMSPIARHFEKVVPEYEGSSLGAPTSSWVARSLSCRSSSWASSQWRFR